MDFLYTLLDSQIIAALINSFGLVAAAFVGWLIGHRSTYEACMLVIKTLQPIAYKAEHEPEKFTFDLIDQLIRSNSIIAPPQLIKEHKRILESACLAVDMSYCKEIILHNYNWYKKQAKLPYDHDKIKFTLIMKGNLSRGKFSAIAAAIMLMFLHALYNAGDIFWGTYPLPWFIGLLCFVLPIAFFVWLFAT